MKIIIRILRKVLGRGMTKTEQIEQLRKGGAHIGKDFHLYGDTFKIDKQVPFMLHIGDYVEITDNVKILNHDYSWCVTKRLSGSLMGGGRTCLDR